MCPKISVRNKVTTSDQGHGLSVSLPPPAAFHSLVGSWVRFEAMKRLQVAVSVIPSVAGRTDGSPQEKRAAIRGWTGVERRARDSTM